MGTQKGNFRRGGMFLLPSTLLAIILAHLLGAPGIALTTIGIFGLGGGFVLILLGNRSQD